jgi:hypothetical protein
MQFQRSLVALLAFALAHPFAASEPVTPAEPLGDPIGAISFEEIPGNTRVESSVITLSGTVGVGTNTPTSPLTVAGDIETTTGYRFPDGSLQATAAATPTQVGSLSGNAGLYNNRIPNFSHNVSFVEVCVKNATVQNDFNNGGGSTQGGNCLPGDVGWVIEVNERAADTWVNARITCLRSGMRLPEVFEYVYSCSIAGVLGLAQMTNNLEWAGNEAMVWQNSSGTGTVTATTGSGGCAIASLGWVTFNNGAPTSNPYRCTL